MSFDNIKEVENEINEIKTKITNYFKNEFKMEVNFVFDGIEINEKQCKIIFNFNKHKIK